MSQDGKQNFPSEDEIGHRFRGIIDSSPMGVHLYRLQGDDRLVFTGANPAADRILGVDNTRYLGLTIEEAFPPLADSEVPGRYREVCRSGEPWHTEQVDYEDRLIRGAFDVHAFRTAECEMAVFFLDITDRKRAEDELLYHFELVRMVSNMAARMVRVPSAQIDDEIKHTLEQIGLAAVVDGCYLFLRATGEEELSLSHLWHNDSLYSNIEEVSRFRLDDLPTTRATLFDDRRPLVVNTVTELPDTAAAERRRNIAAGVGAYVGVPLVAEDEVIGIVGFDSARPSRAWTDGEVALLTMAGQTISSAVQRKRTEKLLEDKDRDFRRLFDTAQVGIYRSRPADGLLLAVNLTGARMLGFDTSEEAIASRFKLNTIYDADTRKALFEEMGKHGEIVDYEAHVVMPRGAEYDFLISARLDQENGLVEGVAMDITARRRAEDDLRRLNLELDARVKARTAELQSANEELETFAYSVSHDLRAPLRAIDGFSAVLHADLGEALGERDADSLERIRNNVTRMQEMIDGMLELSRAGRAPMKMDPVDLSALAVSVAGELKAEEPDREVAVSISPTTKVQGDEALLRVVIQNLLGNAWKFTSNSPAPAIDFFEVEDHLLGQRVFCTRDNGAGFDMNFGSGLFQPFRRLHKAADFTGTGVGLATVKRIIRRHGGDVWAESKPGHGAEFFFSLP